MEWNFVLNSGLLLGRNPPPAQLPRRIDGSRPVVDVTESIPFDNAFFLNRQDGERARKALTKYFRYMVSLVEFPDARRVKREGDSGENEDGGGEPKDENSGLIRLVGIVTSLNDPHALGAERLAPWEFYSITDANNDDLYVPAIEALRSSRSVSFRSSVAADGSAGKAPQSNNSEMESRVANRLSLFCGQVARFTGLYPGAVVGILGTPHRRDDVGKLTSVLVKEIVTVRRQMSPWCRAVAPAGIAPLAPSTGVKRGARIMFLSGPYPRRHISQLLMSAVHHAVQRHVSVLIINGALVPPFGENDKIEMGGDICPFALRLETVVEALETHARSLASTNPAASALKIVLVPALDDMGTVPVLPQPKYSLSLEESPVTVASNPCRIMIDGLTIGVVNYDIVSDMRELMVERMQGQEDGSLLRVVEATLQSRLYVPVTEAPHAKVDLSHLLQLGLTAEVKNLKDKNDDGLLDDAPVEVIKAPEDMPHILFFPSTKPAFAFTTHAWRQDLSDAKGDGSLVINPCLWNKARPSLKYFLNAVEVTIPDVSTVLQRGFHYAEDVVTVASFSVTIS